MNKPLYPELPVLVVDDEPSALLSYDTALRFHGVNNIISLSDSREVIPLLEKQEIEAVVLDLIMPHLSGEELLCIIKNMYPEVPVIIITGLNQTAKRLECTKAGVFQFLTKPLQERDLWQAAASALAYRQLQRGAIPHDGQLQHPQAFAGIITASKKMQIIFHYIEAIAKTQNPVFITGETGTGKELLAHAVHQVSSFRGKFVGVNVEGWDESYFTDTIFGHGAGISGSDGQDRQGLIEAAAGGTLLLDEIGGLPTSSQAQVLRLLDDHLYFPLGSYRSREAKTRLILTTSRPLDPPEFVGSHHEPLLSHLYANRIQVPPLRDRKEDLSLLLNHFVTQIAKEMGVQPPRLSPDILPLLEQYLFPGNVGELQDMVRHAMSGGHVNEITSDEFRRCFPPKGSLPTNES